MAGNSVTLAEETVLRVKQLEVKFENLETDIKMTDCCFSELDADQEEDRDKIDKLEKRVTQLEADLESVSELLEERVAILKVQNVELRNHLNLVVGMVNNITRVLNKTFCTDEAIVNTQVDNEPADEVEDNEPTQLTVQQVFAMYQSQPPDEEGWDEMTAAMNAAEEHEARLQKQQEFSTRVNGLTQAEWDDLLHI